MTKLWAEDLSCIRNPVFLRYACIHWNPPRVPTPTNPSGMSRDQPGTQHKDVSHHYPMTTQVLPEIISICFGMVKMKFKNMFCQAVVSASECLHVSNLLGCPWRCGILSSSYRLRVTGPEGC